MVKYFIQKYLSVDTYEKIFLVDPALRDVIWKMERSGSVSFFNYFFLSFTRLTEFSLQKVVSGLPKYFFLFISL